MEIIALEPYFLGSYTPTQRKVHLEDGEIYTLFLAFTTRPPLHSGASGTTDATLAGPALLIVVVAVDAIGPEWEYLSLIHI